MIDFRVGFGLAVVLLAALVRGENVQFASCEKCPCRLRIAPDGRSATVNLARLGDDKPNDAVLAQRKSAMADRARMLMRTAQDARRRGTATRPMMGWSSWNTFDVNISEEIILSVAHAMATNGLLAAGYDYINIDDGFFGGRDAQGHLTFHPRRFPNGLKGTVDGIHALGFKAGTYSDAGRDTCGSIWNDDALGRGSGLYGHDADDLELHFNTLGFDFIKVDYCGAKAQKLDECERYTEVAEALRATGRTDARLNLCRWAFPGTWAARIAESWRTTRDIRANWASVRDFVGENLYLSAYVSPGHYNDLDMLEVGIPKGAAKTTFKEDTGLAPEEELTHFGMWCIMSSPLLLGCDVRTMPAASLALVTNPFLLAMNQNDLGLAAAPVVRDDGAYVFAKDADAKFGTARYVALYNPTEAPHAFRVAFRDLELDGVVALFDLVERADMGERSGTLEMTVPPHATRFLRLDAERRVERTQYEAETAYLSEYQEVRDPQVAGTAFYQTNALASCGHVVRNLGGRATNDLVWPEVRICEPGPRTLLFRVAARQDGAFLVQVDDAAPIRVTARATAGAFADVSVRLTMSAGIHCVRLSGADLPVPDIDRMSVIASGPLLKLGAPFADGVVLQRDRAVPVWGWASAGDAVCVTFAGQSKKTMASADGKWRVDLDPMPASKEPRTLTVTLQTLQPPIPNSQTLKLSNSQTLKLSNSQTPQTLQASLSDVLVGEVWYVSGQSNAECPLWNNAKDGNNPRFRDANGGLVAQMTYRPFVRMCYASDYKTSAAPREEPRFAVRWEPFTPESLGLDGGHGFSAVGAYYALELYAAIDVPIGIVGSYWGGTRIEPWIPSEGFAAAGFDVASDSLAFKTEKGEDRGEHQLPSRLWNEMVNPFAPMAMRGMIWYQGCSNTRDDPGRYRRLMHALYKGWSAKFENDGMRLYFAQLAPWGGGGHPEFQQAQAAFADEEPNAAIAVINDLGNLTDIHPNRKQDVARRLAVHALKRDYGFDAIEDESPVLRDACVKGDRFVLTFDHAKSFYLYNEQYGSVSNGFEICGADGVWKPGTIHNVGRLGANGMYGGAISGGNVLEVSADGVAEPTKLRYLYAHPWKGTLYNEVCLPLGSFAVGAASKPVAVLNFGRPDASLHMTKSPGVRIMEVAPLSDDWMCRGSGASHNLFSWTPPALKPDEQYTLSVRARSFSGDNALDVLLMRRGANGQVVMGEYPARGVVLGREFREYRFPFSTKGVNPASLNFYLNAKTDPDKGIDIGAVRLLDGVQTQTEVFPIYRGPRMGRAAGKMPVAGTEVPPPRNAYGKSARPLNVLAFGCGERAIRNVQEAFEGLASTLDVLACTGPDQDNFNTDADPETVKRRVDGGFYDLYAVDAASASRIGKQTAEKILGHVRNGAGLVVCTGAGTGRASNGHFAAALGQATNTAWNAAHPFPYPCTATPRVREARLDKGRVLHVDAPSFKVRPPAAQAGVSDFPYQAFADAWMATAFLHAAGRAGYAASDVKEALCRAFNGDAQGRAEARARDASAALAAAKRALTTAGEHWAMVWLLDGKGETLDCRFETFSLPGPTISAFQARADSVTGDAPARFVFACDAPSVTATWTLEDFSGRILERGAAAPGAEIAVPTRALFTNLGIFRLRLCEGGALRDSRTAPVIARDRDAKRLTDDFTVSIWPASSLMSADGEDAVNAALEDIGIRHSLIVNEGAPYQALRAGLGVGGPNLGAFARFGANPQKTNAIDNQPINTREARRAIAEDARGQMTKAARYGVVGAFVCDEPGLVERHALTEPDETPENVAEFRRRMVAKYGAAGEKRGPVRLADARANGDFAGYVEWRDFNVDRWCEAIHTVADAAHEVDPALKLSLFNTFGQTASSGNDYWKLLTAAGLDFSHEYTSLVYFGDNPIYNFDEFYRSFRPDMRMWGFTGYGMDERQIRYTPWWFAAHRYGGMTWFSVWTWEYQLLDIPTLARTQDARMLREALDASQLGDGLGALMLAYAWAPRQTAIYYSHASMLVATLLGTEKLSYEIAKTGPLHDYMFSRQGLERTLEGLLHQYDYVAPAQVTNGVLANYRALFLPRIKALSDDEVAALKAFVARGGVLMADEMPGAYDALGRKRDAPPFAAGEVRLLGRNFDEKDADSRRWVHDVLASNGVSPVLGCRDVLNTTGLEAMHLTDNVNSLYVVMRRPNPSNSSNPSNSQTLTFPLAGFAYDVRAGRALGRRRDVEAKVPLGDAACWSVCAGEAGRFDVALPAVVRQGDDLAFPIRLRMVSGEPGRRLFRVRLVRPDGTSRFHLERKLVAENGVADFRFRMAFNDPTGVWNLTVKDVLTGHEETFPLTLQTQSP